MTRRRSIDGQRALVTGAARGIGERTAALLIARGAKVALVDRDAQAVHDAAGRLGAGATPFVADVTNATALEAALVGAAGSLGGLDLVIANAGIATRRIATIESSDADELDRVMAVNVGGVWNTVRAGLDHVQAGGRFVIVSSVYAYANGALMAPYAASKSAVESLGRSLRVELAPRGIGVTLAYFGPVDTDFVHAFDGDPIATALEQALPASIVSRITPEQAAAAVVEGIERGRARVITPRRWIPLELLRGPFARLGDGALARSKLFAGLVARIEENGTGS
jgi:NAD(P)-dependent dehydrogenase (short-subunit alcohol dehydrogenase family)